MKLNNPPKAWIVLASLLCITTLMIAHAIDAATGAGMIGMIVGYGIGNGIAARNDDPVEPILSHRERE